MKYTLYLLILFSIIFSSDLRLWIDNNSVLIAKKSYKLKFQYLVAKNKKNIAYYKIPVDFEIKGNFLGYIKFKRALAQSKKMLNFDKESISIVKSDTTGAIIAKGVLTIIGLTDDFF